MYLRVKELEFFGQKTNFNEPYLVRGGCNDMLAVKKWNLDYLNKYLGDVEFQMETYKCKKDMEITTIRTKNEYKFSDYIKKMGSNEPPFLYLAESILEVKKDKIDKQIFEDVASHMDLSFGPMYENLFFLGYNTKSGCHIHVVDDFILNQIMGKKTVYLFNYDKNYVKCRSLFNHLPNFSFENVFTMNHENKEIYKVELYPGDSLYIPPWWWHCVESNGLSGSITKVFKRKDYKYMVERPRLIFIQVKLVVEYYISFVYQYFKFLIEDIMNFFYKFV